MLLDPITTHQRRTDCSSRQGVSEFPNPTEGEQNTKSRNGIKRSDSRRKKARVLERSRRHRVGVAVDESPKDDRRVARKRRSTTISKERLSISGHDSGISTASSQDSLARQKGSQRRRRSSARAAERALNQKACLIQATFRGYIGRAKFREQYLLKKLKEIQQRKLEELADIETQKKLELSKLAKGKKESWSNKSEVLTDLLARVQIARRENFEMKKQVEELKKENLRLAIENSCALSQASRFELRINRIELCCIQLHGVGRAYKDALLTGRSMMTQAENDLLDDLLALPA